MQLDREHHAGLRRRRLPGQRAAPRSAWIVLRRNASRTSPTSRWAPSDLSEVADFSAADGDIVYLSFDSPAAKDRARRRCSTATRGRSCPRNRDNRVFVVNNEVWQTGEGIVAARGILDDLRWLNAPIN